MKVAPHTVTAFDDDLDLLRASVCELGGLVESAIAEALEALIRGDSDQAARVVGSDLKVDALAAGIERTAVQLIALRSPLADDLRNVLAAFKIAGLAARMGDCAKNVAHRVELVGDCRGIAQLKSLAMMGIEAGAMVKAALDAFAYQDAAAAARIEAMDRDVDDYRSRIEKGLIELMAEDPRRIATAMQLMFAAQKIERIGDHAVGIAQTVRFAAGADLA